jgi:hypothetical protein
MSVTITSGPHTATWSDGELTGSPKLVKTLQAAARTNFHRGVDLLPTGPTWDITLDDARGTAALATFLNLPWDSDEIDMGEGCLPEYDLPTPTPFWSPQTKRMGKSLGLDFTKHLAGTEDDHDQSTHNPHKKKPKPGHEGTLLDAAPAWEGMLEYLDPDEVASIIFGATLELPDGTTIAARMTYASKNAGGIEVRGVFRDLDAEQNFGTFRFTLRRSMTAHYDSIFLNSSYQGQGIVTAFLSHWEDELAVAGFTKATLDAVAVGRYAWALAGFDFSAPYGRESIRAAKTRLFAESKVSDKLRAEAEAVLANPDFTPLDVALIGHNASQRFKPSDPSNDLEFARPYPLGKALLFSISGWSGTKPLLVPALAKSLTSARQVWKDWATTNPAAVENDDPDFLRELADALAGKLAKSLSANFGKRNRRQAQLMSRLRGARNYAAPVRGGTGAQRRTRGSKFTKGLGLDFAKHLAGTPNDHDQSTHGRRGLGPLSDLRKPLPGQTSLFDPDNPNPAAFTRADGTKSQLVAGKLVVYKTYFSSDARAILDDFLATERGKRLWDAAGDIKVVFRDHAKAEKGDRDSLFQVGVFTRDTQTLEVSLYHPKLNPLGIDVLREAGPFSSVDLQEYRHYEYDRRSNDDIMSTLAHELAHAVDYRASTHKVPYSADKVDWEFVGGGKQATPTTPDLDKVIRYLRPGAYRSLTETQRQEWSYAQRSLMAYIPRGIVETFAVATEMWWRGKTARLRALVRSASVDNQKANWKDVPSFDPDTLINWVESTIERAESK